MSAGSLWDQLAQRKQRTLAARARRGEALVRDTQPPDGSSSPLTAPRDTAVALPVLSKRLETIQLAGMSLPMMDTMSIAAMTVQIQHDAQLFPVMLSQRTVPNTMSIAQLWEHTVGDARVIEQTPMRWGSYDAMSCDMQCADTYRRVRGVLLPVDDGRYVWVEASTEYALYQRDTALWLTAFDALLDRAHFMTTDHDKG